MQRTDPELERSATEQLAKQSGHACRQVLSAGRLRWANESKPKLNPNQ